jgi:hypothetical protein
MLIRKGYHIRWPFCLKTKIMKTDNKMPRNDRDEMLKKQRQNSNQEQQGQSGTSGNENEASRKKNSRTYIKDMPEIKPAKPGVM